MTKQRASLTCDILDSPLGPVAVVSRGRELVAAQVMRSKPSAKDVRRRFHGAQIASEPTEAGQQLREYFAGERKSFTIKADLAGMPPFYRRVLEACAKVPFGTVTTYKDLAAAAGSPNAARAAGSALASNPCLIVIPCHRVVGTNGLGGFSAPGCLAAKRKLLGHEGVTDIA
jgi:methylated-DNA-[protein]-cysteine S-methyltransferase